VNDHCRAIWEIIKNGKVGETYNIGGDNEKTNIEIILMICEILEKLYPMKNNPHIKAGKTLVQHYKDLISFVKDRPGHDRRYAINCEKIKRELNWHQTVDLKSGLKKTIEWYLNHPQWVENVRSGEYQKWLEKNYERR
jgi:dTDP-glucose 4,6-dehydratase